MIPHPFKSTRNRIKFQGEFLSASEIARRHNLSPPTVLRRLAMGMLELELVAPANSYPKAERGKQFIYRSRNVQTPKQARYFLRKAERGVSMAAARLQSAFIRGEFSVVIKRLERAQTRAEIRRMYCAQMVRDIDALWEEASRA